jgi:hypothetical protein
MTCAATPAGLAARWSGENNTNDDKGLFNGTAHGQLAYTQGRFGSAFLLDGTTAYVTADSSDVLWPTGSFSIAAWVKASSISADSYLLVKYGCGGSTACDGNDYEIGVNKSGNPFFNFRINGSPNNILLTAATVNVIDSHWHYLVAERDNTAMEIRLYVDGARAAMKAISGADLGAMGNVDNAPDPVTISGYIQSGTDTTINAMFAGAVDNLEYFTSALSDSEVAAIYAAPDGECQ